MKNTEEMEESYNEIRKNKAKEYSNRYRATHKDKVKEEHKRYRATHKNKIKEAAKKYRETHKDEIKEYGKKYYEKHKKEIKKYREKNKDKLKEKRKKYIEKNREKIMQQQKAYYEKKQQRGEKLLEILNKLILLSKPIKYKKFNVCMPTVNKTLLRKEEKSNPKIGIANYDTKNEGISTLSIITTITDILIQKKLALIVDEKGYIVGAQWYVPPKK